MGKDEQRGKNFMNDEIKSEYIHVVTALLVHNRGPSLMMMIRMQEGDQTTVTF